MLAPPPPRWPEDGLAVVGVATWRLADAECELVTLDAFPPGRGTATALLDFVIDHARSHAAQRLVVVTTNDNLDALRFYQRRRLRLCAVHAGAVTAARRRKPSIPDAGCYGIPVRDELELELPP